MKALSLKQPWAELVLQKRKTIETRTWNTPFRGVFYIHASKQVDAAAMKEFGFASLPTGCIVGIAELTGVKVYPTKESFEADAKHHEVRYFDWHKPRYGFLLKDVTRIDPVPCRGMLNFFPVEYDVLRVLQRNTNRK
jgi:hypothetical protein